MISITIITKNEERNIDRCLSSLSWANEIVIVDSGSTDNTLEICKKYKCKIIESPWMGFGKTKQLAVENATHDWILSIDADEEVSSQLALYIQDAIHSNSAQAYRIKRNSYYLNKEIKFSGWQKDYPLRLFNKNFGKFNDLAVHESVVMNETSLVVRKIKFPIYHYPYPDLKTHIRKINDYTSIAAEEMFEMGKNTNFIRPFLSGLIKFIKIYLIKFGFLDGRHGLILSIISSFYVFLKYAKLWSLKRKQ